LLNEIKKDKYYLDGLFLREYKVWPAGLDPDDMPSIQREFVLYLTAYVPSMDALRNWISYKHEESEILKKDFTKELGESEDVLKTIARARNMSVEAYVKSKLKKIRNNAIKKLRKDYGLETAEEDSRTKMMRKYDDVAKALEGHTAKMEKLSEMFKRPPELRKKSDESETAQSITGKPINES
jgi:uncharacterized protein YeaO (DUF488 family)